MIFFFAARVLMMLVSGVINPLMKYSGQYSRKSFRYGTQIL